ncbi:MAG TPA: hypothetical protein VH063_09165 [Gaiellaceae bacterium]|jgi:hypothetical protein|nr:hypothetical protein [Gaiellaceae bacterium]
MASVNLERGLTGLYAAELGDFVAERTRLVRALRAEDRRAEAASVEELRKPSLVVWTVNQLARRNRKEIRLLLDAGDRLGTEQVALLRGHGESKAFEGARTREQRVLVQLRQAAATILGERASAGTLDRVVATLRAAAISGDAREDLQHGRLKDEVAPVGFEALAAIAPPGTTSGARSARKQPTEPEPPAKPQRNRAAEEAARRQALSEARAALKEAQAGEAAVAKELREAERALRRARDELESTERAAVRLRVEQEAAVGAVEAARRALEAVRSDS